MDSLVQGTMEWRAVRCGKLTASRIHEAIAKTKSGWGASRANVMADLLVERLTGNPVDGYRTPAMQFGTDNEPLARAAYEFMTDNPVELVGFVSHPAIAMSGASPDGLVAHNGLVEIKVPNSATHVDTLLGGSIPDKYQVQMLWQMACTDREWCDFASFDPRLPARMQLHVKRVERDDKRIAELEKDVGEFLTEMAEREQQLRDRYLNEIDRAKGLKTKLETSILMAG